MIRTWSEQLGAKLDPLGMFTPVLHAQISWMLHPQELAEHMTAFNKDFLAVAAHAQRRMFGLPSDEPVESNPDDTRFVDPAWTELPSWDIYKDWYLLWTRRIQDMLHAAPGMSQSERCRAAFWSRQWLNAVAPTNFFWTNPLAMRQALETQGESLKRGWHNFIEDLQAGEIRMTDPGDFKVGVNLAVTPGAVVARNRLLEVIHYKPTQATVHRTPIVIVTPWINKFYILDLVPKKSMVHYLLDQGFDVFITSWKNPDATMADVTFDDYLTEGIDTLVNVARDLSGARQVHAVGYCIGGTALSIYMAWAARAYSADEQPVAHWTLFAALTDFEHPGDIEVFIDEGSVDYLAENMRKKGYLDGSEMATSFRLLRSNPLIWHYYVHSYLYGEKPPPFDALYWNTDTTRMPATMHAWYLRELYLHNRLIQPDSLTLAGQPISLQRVNQPLYAVGTEDDHIAPWQQTFRVMNHVRGQKRYVLSSSGHIFGIVNPPVIPAKRRFCADEVHRTDSPLAWRERCEWTSGSWWEDWIAWLRPQMGTRVKAPALGKRTHPQLEDAPGTYVTER
ncbi:MAG TPA: alpha/beta fold hydrolase [Rhodocyclaceae bacterium]|nr:alpha/beta fold hydrolase [Rhodocyclaceae bacterium]